MFNFYRIRGAKIGENTKIHGVLRNPSNIIIEDNCVIGKNSVLDSSNSNIFIGESSMVGENATINSGVELGDNSVLLPFSVVSEKTKIGDSEIWGGNPAAKICENSDENYCFQVIKNDILLDLIKLGLTVNDSDNLIDSGKIDLTEYIKFVKSLEQKYDLRIIYNDSDVNDFQSVNDLTMIINELLNNSNNSKLLKDISFNDYMKSKKQVVSMISVLFIVVFISLFYGNTLFDTSSFVVTNSRYDSNFVMVDGEIVSGALKNLSSSKINFFISDEPNSFILEVSNTSNTSFFVGKKKVYSQIIDEGIFVYENKKVSLPYFEDFSLPKNAVIIESHIELDSDVEDFRDMSVIKIDNGYEIDFYVSNEIITSAKLPVEKKGNLLTGMFAYNTPSINSNTCYNRSDCNDAINNATDGWTVFLGNNISINESYININTKNNITFDCNGHSITGNNTGFAIVFTNNTNSRLKNCVISGFNTGIFVSGIISYNQSENNIFDNLTLKNNDQALFIYGADNETISNSYFLNNTFGMDIRSVDNSSIHNCVFEDNTYGIYTFFWRHNLLQNSEYIGNDYGIYSTNGNGNLIFNVSSVNDNNSFYMVEPINEKIVNSSSTNSNYGIYLEGDNIFKGNLEVSGFNSFNSNISVYLEEADDSKFYNNYFEGEVGVMTFNTPIGFSNVTFYNNFFKNNMHYNTSISSNITLNFNTSNQTKITTINSTSFGGNYWTNYNGTGYSEVCNDLDLDNFCDEPYILGVNVTDYLPLTNNFNVYCSNCSQCNDYISVRGNNTKYTLTESVGINGSCLEISNKNNITFDCQGYSITGNTTGEGISFLNVSNSTFENCGLINFDNGLKLENSGNNILKNITCFDSDVGIFLSDVINSNIYNSQFDTDIGIIVSDIYGNSSNITFFNNFFRNDFHYNTTSLYNLSIYMNTSNSSQNTIVNTTGFGGNYWSKRDNSGFSQVCDDVDDDNVCDEPYTLYANIIDYLPLTKQTCSDNIKNQDESDIDCGGVCSACINGKSCLADSDCINDCIGNICTTVSSSSSGGGSRSTIIYPFPEINASDEIENLSVDQTINNISNNNITINESSSNDEDTNHNESSSNDEENLDNDFVVFVNGKKYVVINGILDLKSEIDNIVSSCTDVKCKVKIIITSKNEFNINNVDFLSSISRESEIFVNGKKDYDDIGKNIQISSTNIDKVLIKKVFIKYKSVSNKIDIGDDIRSHCVDYPCKVPVFVESQEPIDVRGVIE